jgi:nicotinamide mononucleotide (NMN) deamidase PncC
MDDKITWLGVWASQWRPPLGLSEHKHCNNPATTVIQTARSKMVVSLRGSMGTGKKKDDPSIGRVWAAGFHHDTARSRLARVFKLMNHLFL